VVGVLSGGNSRHLSLMNINACPLTLPSSREHRKIELMYVLDRAHASLCACLYGCVCVCVQISLSSSFCLSLFYSLSFCFSISLCPFLSLSFSLSLSLCMSVYLYLCVSVSLCLCVSLYLVSIPVSLYRCIPSVTVSQDMMMSRNHLCIHMYI